MDFYGRCHICDKCLYDDEHVTLITIYEKNPTVAFTPLMQVTFCEYCSIDYLFVANIPFTPPKEA